MSGRKLIRKNSGARKTSIEGTLPPNLAQGTVLKQGFLEKMSSGLVKRYQERFFRLHAGGALAYAESNAEGAPVHAWFNLEGATLEPAGFEPRIIAIQLSAAEGGTKLSLRAASVGGAESWRPVLESVINPAGISGAGEDTGRRRGVSLGSSKRKSMAPRHPRASVVAAAPIEVDGADASTVPLAAAGGDAPPLRDGWESVLDDETGETFYHHIESGEVCWDRPAKGLPAGWVAFDKGDGRTYYHNQETGATSWIFPTHAASTGASTAEAAAVTTHSVSARQAPRVSSVSTEDNGAGQEGKAEAKADAEVEPKVEAQAQAASPQQHTDKWQRQLGKAQRGDIDKGDDDEGNDEFDTDDGSVGSRTLQDALQSAYDCAIGQTWTRELTSDLLIDIAEASGLLAHSGPGRLTEGDILMAFSRHATTPASSAEQQQAKDKTSPVLHFDGFSSVCTELADKKAMTVLSLARCLTPKGHRSVSLAGSADGNSASPASGRTSFAAYNMRTLPTALSISASTPTLGQGEKVPPPPDTEAAAITARERRFSQASPTKTRKKSVAANVLFRGTWNAVITGARPTFNAYAFLPTVAAQKPRSAKVKHAMAAVEEAVAQDGVGSGERGAGEASEAEAERAAVSAAEKLEAEAQAAADNEADAPILQEPPEDAQVQMRIDDRYSNYRGYIAADGACYNNRDQVIGYVNADSGEAGSSQLEFLGRVVRGVSGEWLEVVDDMDELCGLVDLGKGYIQDHTRTTVAEIDKRGCVSGHSGSYLGQFSPFTYHDMKLLVLYSMLIDPGMLTEIATFAAARLDTSAGGAQSHDVVIGDE